MEIETAKYTITGLVDIFDEQGNITGQFPIGSVQELPVHIGSVAVEDGRAELVDGSEQVREAEEVVEEGAPVLTDEAEERSQVAGDDEVLPTGNQPEGGDDLEDESDGDKVE